MVKTRYSEEPIGLLGHQWLYNNGWQKSTIESSLPRNANDEVSLGSGNYKWQDHSTNHGNSWTHTYDRKWAVPSEFKRFWRGGPASQYYDGRFLAKYGIAPALSVVDGAAWGPEAYDRMKPTKPEFEALNALYELRELPDLLRKRYQESGLDEIADWYLAYQFGWKPLLSDIRNLCNTQRVAQPRLKQLLRDNGRPVRRRVTLRDETSSTQTVTDGFDALIPLLVTQYYRYMPRQIDIVGSTDKVWASARFRYWLPDGPRDINWTRRMLAAIYGLQVRPSVVYNAVPWSWLVDWFGNLGDIIANLDAGVANRLAADYFYVMRERTTFCRRTARGYFYDTSDQPLNIHSTSTFERKTQTRRVGDPFGFASVQDDLNAHQLSILGALGISKLK